MADDPHKIGQPRAQCISADAEQPELLKFGSNVMESGAEELFDRAFKDCEQYKGRDNLTGLPAALQQQLRLVQQVFTQSLKNEKHVPEHVPHPPFHVDFVISDFPNALAFRHDDYSFIGITVPLILAMSDVCLLVSRSKTVSALLKINPADEDYNKFHAALFFNLCAFIVAHEYTHIVHGHICTPVAAFFANEIQETASRMSLKNQIEELVADGYSIYHVLANLFDSGRHTAIGALEGESLEVSTQDQILLCLAIVAVAAYLFKRPLPRLTVTNIYRNSHPPQIVRMDLVMQEAKNWCSQNRPELREWMDPARFHKLIDAVTEATLGLTSAQVAGEQAAFMKSCDGKKYYGAIADGVNAYKMTL